MDPIAQTVEAPGPNVSATSEADGTSHQAMNDQQFESLTEWLGENDGTFGLGDINWDSMDENAIVEQDILPTISYDQDFRPDQSPEAVDRAQSGVEEVDIPSSSPAKPPTQHNPEVAQPFETSATTFTSSGAEQLSPFGEQQLGPLGGQQLGSFGGQQLGFFGGEGLGGHQTLCLPVPYDPSLPLPATYFSGYQNQVNYQAPRYDNLGWTNPAHSGYYANALAGSSLGETTMNTRAPTSIFPSAFGTPYRNEVLNSFVDAETPLRIIDSLSYPFPLNVQTALSQSALQYANQKLEVKKLRRMSQDKPIQDLSDNFGIPSGGNSILQQHNPLVKPEQGGPLTLITSMPTEPHITQHLGVPEQTPTSARSGVAAPGQKIRKNTRSQNIANIDPSQYYTRLAKAPESWSGRSYRGSNVPQFVYTKYGELEPTRYLSANDIVAYLSDHPLHFTNGAVSTKQSRLTIWIQTVPADSNKRYPQSGSSKCRFEFCPDPHHTIRAGEYRLAFDEQHLTNWNTDPYHNAFYVHLYCMEKNFNFPQLCRDFNVVPDCRKLPEPTNRMAINRDHPSMKQLCLNFIHNAPSKAQFDDNPLHGWFKKSLTRRLTKEHIIKGSSHSKKKRRERGGINIEVHLGNLDMQAEMKQDRKHGKGLATPPPEGASPSSKKSPKKRRSREAVEPDDENETLQSDILDQEYMSPKQKRTKQD